MIDDRLRLPPQNLDAERGVLGSILLMNNAIDEVSTWLKVDHFYSDAHQKMYAAIRDLYERGVRGIDAITLSEELVKRKQFEDIGGVGYIAQILDAVPHAAHVRYYANIVREKWIIRSTIYASNETMQECYDPNIQAADILQNADRRLSAISESQVSSDGRDLAAVNSAAIARIKQRRANRGRLTGVTSGFMDFDRVTNGWQPSELNVLAARPSMGKTAFLCKLAFAAASAGHRVKVFSMEQGDIDLSERMLAQRATVDSHALRSGDVSDTGIQQLEAAESDMQRLPINIDSNPSRSLAQIVTITRREHRRNGLDLLLIDYLQLIEPEDRRIPRDQQVARISKGLKQLARELRIPVVALAQLNRAVEGRDDKRPRLGDLRESGNIEQDADLVVLLHRPDAYNAEERPGEAELIVAKNRNGPTSMIRLTWRKEYMQFENYAPMPDIDYTVPSDRRQQR